MYTLTIAYLARHPRVAYGLVVASLVLLGLSATHHLGWWGWYAGHLNGGLWVGNGGVELWGHPGFFTGKG
jgi:hypothetical protein